MNNSINPKRRRRSAPADPDDNRNDVPPDERPVDEFTEPDSHDAETVEARKEPHDTKMNLYRQSCAIAQRYGAFIGRDAFFCAVKEFQPSREDFNESGSVSIEGACELTRLMGEAIATYKDYSCHVWQGMTKAELNLMRKVQGLPPV